MLHLLVRGLQLFVDPFALDEDGWAIQLSCLSSAGHSERKRGASYPEGPQSNRPTAPHPPVSAGRQFGATPGLVKGTGKIQ
jgi:hypothetical protein